VKRTILLVAALSAAALFCLCDTVVAYDLSQVQIEFWAGAGANEALLVVDFWPYNAGSDSFAFGYRFDGSITGIQLLDGVQAASQGFSYAQKHGFLNDIWYVKGEVTHHTTYDWPNSWWSYCTSSDLGETWVSSWVGAGDRMLADGDCDGWLGSPGDDWTSTPMTPLVPEPASVTALALGVAAALVWRRR